MKISMAIASALLLGGVLTACGDDGGGGSGGSDYCKDIKAAQKKFDSLTGAEAGSFGDAITTFHELADNAPSDIKDDWKTLDTAFTTVEKALKDAGIEMSDFDKIQAGEIPEGVDLTKLAGMASEFQKLNTPEFTKATENIEKHAKDVCKVDLSAS